MTRFAFSRHWVAVATDRCYFRPLAYPMLRATVTFDQLELELVKLNHLVAYRFDKAAVAGALPS